MPAREQSGRCMSSQKTRYFADFGKQGLASWLLPQDSRQEPKPGAARAPAGLILVDSLADRVKNKEKVARRGDLAQQVNLREHFKFR